MTTCLQCHHHVTPGASFCASCGTAIVAAQPEGARDPFIGQTFKGMYFVEMRIGGGGVGDVYRARHVTLDVPVALKILKKSLLSDPSVVQRFHREARAASRLRHPNVISVTDFGQTDDGTLYMAMEYVAGKSLARAIAEDFPLFEQRIARIGRQILSALAEAHANQVLHRDLKPDNVMLEARRDEPDAVKVLDFGIAKIQMTGEGSATLTQDGLICGTPGYMSPEQWSGEQLDARSDLYSVGVILYEMLTGKLPFEVQTPMETVRKQLTEKVVPPSARRDDGAVSPDLEGLVMRALSSEREDRWASAEEMRDGLLACVLLPETASVPQEAGARKTVVLQRGPTPPRPPIAPVAPLASPPRHEMDAVDEEAAAPPSWRRSRVPLVAGAVAAAIALLGSVYVASRIRGERRAEEAQRAAEDATRRADEEARRRAADVRARVEEEAKRLVEEEARRRSAQDTTRSTEEDARKRSRAEEKKRFAEEKRRPREVRYESRAKLFSFPLPPAKEGKGVLSINAEPPGGNVLVNGVSCGRAPREILVPTGDHDVRITFKAGAQSKQIKVRAGTREAWTAIFKVD
jgi:serine/threonine protein kinase